jgi:hypothetical protein
MRPVDRIRAVTSKGAYQTRSLIQWRVAATATPCLQCKGRPSKHGTNHIRLRTSSSRHREKDRSNQGTTEVTTSEIAQRQLPIFAHGHVQNCLNFGALVFWAGSKTRSIHITGNNDVRHAQAFEADAEYWMAPDLSNARRGRDWLTCYHCYNCLTRAALDT